MKAQRTYNSHGVYIPNHPHYSSVPLNRGSMFGHEWRHHFDRRLYPVGPMNPPATSLASVHRPDGTVKYFRLSGLEAEAPPHQTPAKLIKLLTVCPADPAVACWEYRAGESTEVERYNSNGMLLEIADGVAGQHAIRMKYDAEFRLIGASDESGRSLTFAYNGYRVTSITASDGRVIAYQYDEPGRLTSVVLPPPAVGGSNVTRVYHYEDARPQHWPLITGITDERGVRLATYTYDDQGRVTSTVRAPQLSGGTIARHTYSYDSTGFGAGNGWTTQTTVVDPLGSSKVYTIQSWRATWRLKSVSAPCATCGTGSLQDRTYDASGYIDVETDFRGTAADRDHDDQGRETRRVEAKSTPTQSNPPERRTVETDWNGEDLPEERRTLNATGVIERLQRWAYNARNQVVASCSIDPADGAAVTYACGSATNAPPGVRQTRRIYCDAIATGCPIVGLLSAIDGPRIDVEDTTSYFYRDADESSCAGSPTTCPYRKGDLWKVTNALGHVTETLTYDGAGRPLRVKDPDGVFTDFEYSPRGWLTARKVRGTNDTVETDDAITRIDYDATGNATKVTQPDASHLTYTYDDAQRLTRITDPTGAYLQYVLDAAGNRRVEKSYTSGNALRRRLAREYDTLSRLDRERDALNASGAALTGTAIDDPTQGRLVADHAYDGNGNRVETLDGLGNDTDQEFDPLNRLVRTLDALRPQCPGGDLNCGKTQFTYDARDNLRTVTDARGLVTSYAYDGLDNLTGLTSPDTGATSYGYDAAGNRLTQTDARNVTASYAYDALNRLTAVTYPSAALNLTHRYDQIHTTCPTAERFPKGRLTELLDATGSTRYCHDRFGNLLRKIAVVAGITQTTRYSYNLAGKLTQVIYPSGHTVSYSRDTAGRISKVRTKLAGQSTFTDLVTTVAYQPLGPISKLTYLGGSTLDRVYDANYALDRLDASQATGLDLDVGVDVMGNITTATETIGSAPANRYDYDPLYRLSAQRDGASALIEGYAYDAIGNRTSKQVGAGAPVAYSYGPGSHRLTAVGGVPRSYDANGNTTVAALPVGSPTLGYNDRNRLATVTGAPAGAVSYGHNARGERTTKTVAGTTSLYAYDESGRLLGEYDAAGAAIREYVWLDDLPVGMIQGTAVLAIHPDGLGTPRRVMDLTRAVAVWKWPYLGNAFGEVGPQTDPDADGTQVTLGLRFPGQYADSETGLAYNYFRDYEPGTGRYVESDPIGLDGGINMYVYAIGAPLRNVDRKGKSASAICIPASVADGPAPFGEIACVCAVAYDLWRATRIAATLSAGAATTSSRGCSQAANDPTYCKNNSCPLVDASATPTMGASDGNVHELGSMITCQYRCPTRGLVEETHFIAPEMAPTLSNRDQAMKWCPQSIPEY